MVPGCLIQVIRPSKHDQYYAARNMQTLHPLDLSFSLKRAKRKHKGRRSKPLAYHLIKSCASGPYPESVRIFHLKRTCRHILAIERPPFASLVQEVDFLGLFQATVFYPSPSSRENHSGCRRGSPPLLTTVSCEISK